jgi:DNA replication ATP-dependent helicase Dna2
MLSRVYQDLKEALENEAKQVRRVMQERLAEPIQKRVERGRCIASVRVDEIKEIRHDEFFERILILSCEVNDSEFREGDLVCLHDGDPLLRRTEAVWCRESEMGFGRHSKIWLRLTRSHGGHEVSAGASYVLDVAWIDLFEMQSRALEACSSSERGRDRILPLFDEEVPANCEFDPDCFDQASAAAETAGFNSSQIEAIAGGSAAEWFFLVQGPPGTGKTRVLAQIARNRVLLQGQRVLVTAATHRAINEALERIRKVLGDEARVVKIADILLPKPREVEVFEDFAKSGLQDVSGGYVVGATPYACMGRRLKGLEFDCVVFDEASQMTPILAILAMLKADRYVFIGDSKQLPPVLASVPSGEAAGHSVFRRLEQRRDAVLLDVTYRMHAAITEWVSQSFYSCRLTAASMAADRRYSRRIACRDEILEKILDPESPLTWVEFPEVAPVDYAKEEVVLIGSVVAALLGGGVRPDSIGVVTPFRRHARRIARRLAALEGRLSVGGPDVLVDTVERFQGQERDVIVIATGIAERHRIDALAEFLLLPQRLNVAVSRARMKVIVVAAAEFVRGTPSNSDEAEWMEHWRSLRSVSAQILV